MQAADEDRAVPGGSQPSFIDPCATPASAAAAASRSVRSRPPLGFRAAVQGGPVRVGFARQGIALGHVLPGHGDQPVRDLVIGRDQGEPQADIGLSTEIGAARHRTTPSFFLQREAVGAVPDKQAEVQLFLRGLAQAPHTRGHVPLQGGAGKPPPVSGYLQRVIWRCPWHVRTPAAPPAAGHSSA